MGTNQRSQIVMSDDEITEFVTNSRTGTLATIGADGQPRPDFYTENRLNLNARGYEAWTAAVRPAIERLTSRRTP